MTDIEAQEERQWIELCDFVQAEVEYFNRCKEIMEELRESWPTGYVDSPPSAPHIDRTDVPQVHVCA